MTLPSETLLSWSDVVERPVVIVLARVSDFAVENLVPDLSDVEYARMQRFRGERDVQRYVVAHYIKRLFLSKYLSLPMSELEFDCHAYGKPFCRCPYAPYFNLSHSDNWVALSVSTLADVGVDIEFPRKVSDALVKKVSSSKQFERYKRSGSSLSQFLNLWTQKEAVSKSCGRGISVGLENIECTGDLGVHSLIFSDMRYHLYSCLLPDDGVLSYASTAAREPAIIKIEVRDARVNDFTLACVE
jgi:phosphopantetheinyl transferase